MVREDHGVKVNLNLISCPKSRESGGDQVSLHWEGCRRGVPWRTVRTHEGQEVNPGRRHGKQRRVCNDKSSKVMVQQFGRNWRADVLLGLIQKACHIQLYPRQERKLQRPYESRFPTESKDSTQECPHPALGSSPPCGQWKLHLRVVGRAIRIHVSAQREGSFFLDARTEMEDKTLFLLQHVLHLSCAY